MSVLDTSPLSFLIAKVRDYLSFASYSHRVDSSGFIDPMRVTIDDDTVEVQVSDLSKIHDALTELREQNRELLDRSSDYWEQRQQAVEKGKKEKELKEKRNKKIKQQAALIKSLQEEKAELEKKVEDLSRGRMKEYRQEYTNLLYEAES